MTQKAKITATAKALGIDARMIRKYIEWGTVSPPDDDGLFDIHRVKCEYYLHTNPARRRRTLEDLGLTKEDLDAFKAAKRTLSPATDTAPQDPPAQGDLPIVPVGGTGIVDKNKQPVSFTAIKARHELVKTEITNQKLNTIRGQLISRDEVEHSAFTAGQVLRDQLLNLPDYILPYISDQADMPVIKERIREFIEELQENLKKTMVVNGEESQ